AASQPAAASQPSARASARIASRQARPWSRPRSRGAPSQVTRCMAAGSSAWRGSAQVREVADEEHLVERAGAIALEVERDEAEAERLDRGHHRARDGGVERARQLGRVDLDARQLAVVA